MCIRDRTRVGTGAGILDRVFTNLIDVGVEKFFGNTVLTISLRNSKLFIHLTNRINERIGQLLVRAARQADGARDLRITLHAGAGIILDDGRKQNRIAAAMRDIKDSPCLVRQAVRNAKDVYKRQVRLVSI